MVDSGVRRSWDRAASTAVRTLSVCRSRSARSRLVGHSVPFDGEHGLGGEDLHQPQVRRRQRPPVHGQQPARIRRPGRDQHVGGVGVGVPDRRARATGAGAGRPTRSVCRRRALYGRRGESAAARPCMANPILACSQHGVHGVGGVDDAGRRGGDELRLGLALGGLPGADAAAVDDGRDGDPDDDENDQGEGVLGLGDGERAVWRGVEVVGQQAGDHRGDRGGQRRRRSARCRGRRAGRSTARCSAPRPPRQGSSSGGQRARAAATAAIQDPPGPGPGPVWARAARASRGRGWVTM